MSRISNLTTIKIGIFKSWNAYWFDKTHYASLLFNDLKIRDYLTGLFYRLKIISDYIYIYRLLNNNVIVKTNLIFFSNLKFKSITLRKVYHLNEQFVFFYKKKSWNHFLIAMKLFYEFFFKKEVDTAGNIIVTDTLNNDIVFPTVYITQLSLSFFSSFFNYFYILCYFMHYLKSSVFFLHLNSCFSFDLSRLLSVAIITPTINDVIFSFNYSMYSIFNFIFLFLKDIQLSNFNWLFIDWVNSSYISNIRFSLLYFIKYLYYFLIHYLQICSILKILNNIFKMELAFLETQSVPLSYNYFSEHTILQPISLALTRRSITQSLFMLFKLKIESSIYAYEQQFVYLNFAISFKKNPFIISAKLITDSLVYLLQSGKPVVKSFFFIKNWQAALYTSRRRLEYIYYQSTGKYITNLNYLFFYAVKRSPVIGIRIECSGTFKKGRMSRVYFYTSWVKNDILTGKMPNNTLIADIDYYQYFAITKGSSIGIKTWIFLETHIYNNNHKYISLVY